MKKKYWIFLLFVLLIGIGSFFFTKKKPTACKTLLNRSGYEVGESIDSLNGVVVYYNGAVSNVVERNLSDDGYNIGLKYQCVEFVKRYYYEYLKHKMPDSYGHAKDFFDARISDGERNPQRNLIQYTNPSISKPEVSDLIVMSGTVANRYGHVAIVSAVYDEEIEIIQQNPGANAKSRVKFSVEKHGDKYYVDNARVMGWLRKK